jgi:hypothetical protein
MGSVVAALVRMLNLGKWHALIVSFGPKYLQCSH